jgi:hypothetical protein
MRRGSRRRRRPGAATSRQAPPVGKRRAWGVVVSTRMRRRAVPPTACLTCRSCATCMHSDALRCNPMSSDVIRCHRMSSAGITPACPVGLAPGLRGTRRGRRYCGEGASAVVSICMHSDVIRCHQISSDVIRYHQRASHLVASSQMSGADESQRPWPTGTSSSYNSAEQADSAGAMP